MFVLIIIWTLFLVLHSVLADAAVKTRIMKLTGLSEKKYRIAYNLFNSSYLLIVLVVLFRSESGYLFRSSLIMKITGFVVSVSGLGLMMNCFRHYQLSQFLGLREEVNMQLNTKGPNRFVRHPLYAGTILFVTGICVYWPLTINWIFLILMIIYIIIGIRIEEKKLIKIFGDEYIHYMCRTRKLIPFIY